MELGMLMVSSAAPSSSFNLHWTFPMLYPYSLYYWPLVMQTARKCWKFLSANRGLSFWRAKNCVIFDFVFFDLYLPHLFPNTKGQTLSVWTSFYFYFIFPLPQPTKENLCWSFSKDKGGVSKYFSYLAKYSIRKIKRNLITTLRRNHRKLDGIQICWPNFFFPLKTKLLENCKLKTYKDLVAFFSLDTWHSVELVKKKHLSKNWNLN